MNDKDANRDIWVSVKDDQGLPLIGAAITFWEDGKPRGSVPLSEGRATIFPARKESIVEVEAKYGDRVERRKLAAEAVQAEFIFPAAHTSGKAKSEGEQDSAKREAK